MKKTQCKHYRQGDVLIERVSEIPANAIKQKKSERIVLAHGAATGHHHTLKTSSPVIWFKLGDIPSTSAKASTLAGEIFVSLPTGGEVTHEEHSTIRLLKGDYRVTRQREYSPEAIRNVAD